MKTRLGLLGRREGLRGDAALAAAKFAGEVFPAPGVDLSGADCVVDAIFGAGLARDVEGEARAIVERINAFARRGGRVVAVDVPSGLDGATGKARGVAVEATSTVTFFRLKPATCSSPAGRSADKSASPTSAFQQTSCPHIAAKGLRQFADRLARRAAAARSPPRTNMRAGRRSSSRARRIRRARPGSPRERP